ncbi:MAG: hypothetical protein Q8916_04105 [Bacteroidota bacterium]|nr:hypothetical protein [Bacteroidota bacterium]MDP4229572.1 hypothetical protein [Bacteroidota bacterium]MDP4237741.1 hypothetical protein [Bacteroidota bacterium]
MLHNTEFRITFSNANTGRLYYRFAKNASGWYQKTAAGNRHKATAEQVLNHLLPALSGIKPNAKVTVDYRPAARSTKPASKPSRRSTTKP